MQAFRRRTCRVAIFAILATTVGCGGSPEIPDSSGDKKEGSTVGVSLCSLGDPWRRQMEADIRAAADEHPGLTVVFKNAKHDASRQRSHVEQFIADGVDLIIISLEEPQTLTPPVEAAMDAGIPVIVLDRAIIGDKYACFIAADNAKLGRAAGKWVVESIGGEGKIVELKGPLDSPLQEDRHRGFRDALNDYPMLRQVDDPPMQGKVDDARKAMQSALDRFDKIDAVYGYNDAAAYDAYLAAQEVGREKEMIFVGINALPEEGIRYVKEGILHATFKYPTGGAEAIDAARKILAGNKLPRNIRLPSRRFTRENVGRGGEPLD